MRQAIKLDVKGIKCDNPGCEWKDETAEFKDYKKWLNKPCPMCGSNLMTSKDVEAIERTNFLIRILNKMLPVPEDGGKYIRFKVDMDGTGQMIVREKEVDRSRQSDLKVIKEVTR